MYPLRKQFWWLLVVLVVLVACAQNESTGVDTATVAVSGDTATRPTPTTELTNMDRPIYQDAAASIPARVEDLLRRMTLAEKIGQMTLIEKNSLRPDDVTTYLLGGVLSGGGGSPNDNTPQGWAEMVNAFQAAALQTPLAIPIIYGVDAVHGHGNLRGATIFPHNIGLGAAHNPELVQQIGQMTAVEMAATGIYWNYAPVVAVPQDIRWGRTYEGYSENTALVTQLSTAYLQGLQTPVSEGVWVIGTPKHYIGDGGTAWGSSTTGDYQIDQGVTQVDEVTLRAVHLPPYQATIENGALSIMISYSSWQETKMHGQDYLINDLLKGELGFDGFIVSDWQAIDQMPGSYYDQVVASLNAGLDMIMVPYDTVGFMATATQAVTNGDVPQARIDDAVRRILTVKFQLGLFEHPLAQEELIPLVGSETHRQVAREAVRQSLVLLQNEGDVLPLHGEVGTIFVAGAAADSIGIQSGGWTLEWQGTTNNANPGTTILAGIENAVAVSTTVHYNKFGNFDPFTNDDGSPLIAEVGIAVVGERPYAEGPGDDGDLTLPTEDLAMLANLRPRVNQLIVIIISGRPIIITNYLPDWDAVVAAWLPGTEGQGVADVLFGDYPFTGTLPYTWPRTVNQLPFDFPNLPTSGDDAPLYPFGFGLK